MFFRQPTDTSSPFGSEAKVGLSALILDKDGHVCSTHSVNETTAFTMASTKKIAIAMAVFKKILTEKGRSLATLLPITEFSPGLPSSPFDKYFFAPGAYPPDAASVGDLLKAMLQHSDNTSTDALLSFIGGPQVVNALMKELNILSYNLTRTSKDLLTYFYDAADENGNIKPAALGSALRNAFTRKPTEEILFNNKEDSCSPRDMAELLKLIILKSRETSLDWLTQASKMTYALMQHCATGKDLINKAVTEYHDDVESFGHKTGGLGSIRNDVGFINLHDGRTIILTIFTGCSDLPLEKREALIAEMAREVLQKEIGPTLSVRASLSKYSSI